MPSAEVLQVKVRVAVDFVPTTSSAVHVAKALKEKVEAHMRDGWELSRTLVAKDFVYLVFTMQWVNHPGREP